MSPWPAPWWWVKLCARPDILPQQHATQSHERKYVTHSLTGEDRKTAARAWFESLRDQICGALEKVEDDFQSPLPAGRFVRKPWVRPEGGGGVMSMLAGRVFE